MSNEITVQSSLRIVVGNKQFQTLPQGFNADLSAYEGPAPGIVTATVYGTVVDLTAFGTPGWCWVQNQDSTNYVTVGPYDPQTLKYYPFLRVGPEKFVVFEFAPTVESEYDTGTGTGTIAPDTNRVMVRANAASCTVAFLAWEA